MAQTARCKFYCQGVYKSMYSEDQVMVELQTLYDENIPEDQKFSLATPWGDLKFALDNPALAGFFEPGKQYYIDIARVESD